MGSMTEAAGSSTVLVVEDDLALLRTLEDTFKAEGMNVQTATDGEVGLQMIQEERPKVVVLDLMLSKMSGVDVLKKLRAEEWGKDLPVVVATNLTYMQGMADVKKLATDFMLKGDFELDELVKKVRSYLEGEQGAA